MKATSLSWWYLLRGPGSLCEAANPTVNVATRPWLSTGSCCGGAPFVLLTYWVPEVLAPNRHQGVYHCPLSQGEEEKGRVDVGGGAGGEERRVWEMLNCDSSVWVIARGFNSSSTTTTRGCESENTHILRFHSDKRMFSHPEPSHPILCYLSQCRFQWVYSNFKWNILTSLQKMY